MIGWPEALVIGIIALLLFGPKRVIEWGEALGKAKKKFENAQKDEVHLDTVKA